MNFRNIDNLACVVPGQVSEGHYRKVVAHKLVHSPAFRETTYIVERPKRGLDLLLLGRYRLHLPFSRL